MKTHKFLSSPLSPTQIVQSKEYLPFIFPSALPLLHNPNQKGEWILSEARAKNRELLGVILLNVIPFLSSQVAHLDSFVVSPLHRRQGIGTALFAFTQELLQKEKKISRLEMRYTQEDPSGFIIEKILSSQGWPKAKTILMRAHFDVDAFAPPWIHTPYPLPPPFLFFPWKELSSQDRLHISHLLSQGRTIPPLNPFIDEEQIDLETSFGLRYNKEVVGWSITHRLDPATLQYSKLYIDQALLHQGYGIQLLVQSIRGQKALGIPQAIFEIDLQTLDRSWWHFIKKRLFPLSAKIEHVKKAIK